MGGIIANCPPWCRAPHRTSRQPFTGHAPADTRQIGGAIDLAVLATVAAHRTGALQVGESNAAALADGYGRANRLGSIIALGTAAAAFIIPGGRHTAARSAVPIVEGAEEG